MVRRTGRQALRNDPQQDGQDQADSQQSCTIRGRVTGPEIPASARILPLEAHAHARQTINRKYWLAWLTQPFSKSDTYLEIAFDGANDK
jgi:hypothetical protein